MHGMKTALIYDWLVTIGGGEKTLSEIFELYPAPIYTLVKDEAAFRGTRLESADIKPSFIQKLPYAKKCYRNYLPLFPFAIEQFDLGEYEIVLSASHAVAKGVLTHPEQLHLCYCFTPIRYAWDLYHSYMQEVKGVKKYCAKWALHKLRQWDIASINRVDHFAAISNYVSRRIKKIYGRESIVIYPPVACHQFQISPRKEEYYVTVSRMVPYKKMELIVEAFSQMPEKKLVVIGDGPEFPRVKAKAKKNIELLGHQPDNIVRKYLAEAKAFVFAAQEDFGIIVLEAQAAGTPVIALGRGGALETVLENQTGVFFPDQTVESLIVAVEDFEKRQGIFDPYRIKQHAELFNEERFKLEFKRFVDQKIQEFHEDRHTRRRVRYAPLASISELIP
jgi:glycosyltransferase involved in cell wall biosynthesis